MPKPGIGSTAGVVVLFAVVLIAGCAGPAPSNTTEEPGSATTTSSALGADTSVSDESTRPTYVRETPLPGEIVERNTPEPSPEAEEEFFSCLEEAGYTKDDFYRFNPAGEVTISEDDPGYADRAEFKEVEDRCSHGTVGHVAKFDPEYVAAANESLLIEAQCMQDLGWSDFPDPVPGEGDLLVSGLRHANVTGTFAPPIDPEEKEHYESDREYCGEQSGRPYFRE